jgi:hypothetical protein
VDPGSASGTDPFAICVESAIACETTEECPSGFICLDQMDGSRACSPDLVACTSDVVTCPAKPTAECPAGFRRSFPDGCTGPCVPLERCACTEDWECLREPASCDRVAGQCRRPLAPAPRCGLPFDPGACLASMLAFAFIDGECREVTYGGCEGNDNRFNSLETCRSYCEGLPNESACEEGYVPATICAACGAGGGCMSTVEVCAQTCTEDTDCDTGYFRCSDGICQVTGCV